MKTWALVFSTKRIVRRILYDDDFHNHLSSTNKHSLNSFCTSFYLFPLSPYIYFDHASIHVSSLHGKDQHGGHVYQKALLSHDCRSTCVLTYVFARYIIRDMGKMGHSCQRLLQ